jgi:hypothetical protein
MVPDSAIQKLYIPPYSKVSSDSRKRGGATYPQRWNVSANTFLPTLREFIRYISISSRFARCKASGELSMNCILDMNCELITWYRVENRDLGILLITDILGKHHDTIEVPSVLRSLLVVIQLCTSSVYLLSHPHLLLPAHTISTSIQSVDDVVIQQNRKIHIYRWNIDLDSYVQWRFYIYFITRMEIVNCSCVKHLTVWYYTVFSARM